MRTKQIALVALVLGLSMTTAQQQPAPETGKPAPAAQDPGIARINERKVVVEDCTVHLLESGPEYGQVVILLHGGRFTSEVWREHGVLEALARAGRRVFAPDLPGFGQTKPCSVPKEKFLEKLLPLLTERKPVVLASSMSGAFAFPFLLDHADRVAGFIAVSPAGIDEYRDRLSRITVPVLAIWGEKDTSFPVEVGKRLVEAVPKGELFVMPDAPHPCYLKDPKAFTERILRYLDDLPAERGAPRKLDGDGN
ncbi:MAG: hypothetical protein BroJett003_07970 [Planctomycetota bacterium]|nr:MAG: hypothetical protein BroJett003_07970 [Planctomycetota bacterium]